jgi:hypothetical protein
MYGNAQKDLGDNIFVQRVFTFFENVTFWYYLSS